MQIRYSYDDAPTIRRFTHSQAFIRGLMGPFGCLSGETLVITEQGPLRIDAITRPMRVLSYVETEGRFLFVPASAARRKGTDALYRVRLPRGEWRAAGHHRALCADGTYRQVRDLRPGDRLLCCDGLAPICGESGRSSSRASVPHCLQTDAGWSGRCGSLFRRYGRRLRRALDAFRYGLPSLHGAQGCASVVSASAHNHPGRPCVRPATRDYQHQSADHVDVTDHAARAHAEHIERSILQPGRYASISGGTVPVFSLPSSCRHSASERTILAVERETVESEYWDIQVPGTCNYVTADGAIHHNSGKSSGSVMEFPRIAHEQAPGPDGIRRTRFGVIRNTYRQLRETTLETVMHWLPEVYFGRYNTGHHRYNITGFKGVEIELLFCALDRPDQVSNLLSLELTGAFVNEAREVPWAIIKPLMGRVGRYKPMSVPCTWSGIFMDTNPPEPESWWYELFEEPTLEVQELARLWQTEYYRRTGRTRPYAEVFKQPSGLSPEAENLRFLEPGYYQLLAVDPDQDWVKVHVHGEYGFTRDGKPVYPTYRDNIHCREFGLIEGRIIRRGWDFGLTPACVFAQTTPAGQLRYRFELCATRAGIADFADEVIAFCRENLPGYRFSDHADPAGAAKSDTDMRSCFDILEGKGIDPDPGPVDLTARLEPVRYGLGTMVDGEPGLLVHPDCKLLRRGFQGKYQYKRKMTSQEAYSDKPDKNAYSHPHDAAQYVAADHFGEAVTAPRMIAGHVLPGHLPVPDEPPARPRSRNPLRDQEPEAPSMSYLDDFDPYGDL